MPHSQAIPKTLSALAWASLGLAVAIALALGLSAMEWGLPSSERVLLAYGVDPKETEAPELSAEEMRRLWEDYPNYLPSAPERSGRYPRSDFNALRSFHPDEYVILKGLANMNPRRLELFPGFFAWPAMQFYAVGAALRLSQAVGAVEVVRDVPFYFTNPVQIARMYVIGRMVTLLMGVFAIVAFWAGACRLWGDRAAAASALFLATAPLFSVNSHYMTADVPMLTWIALVFWASTIVLKSERPAGYVMAGLFVGFAGATRYQGALSALLVLSAHLFRATESPDARPARGLARRDSVLGLVFDSRLWMSGLISVVVFLAVNRYAIAKSGEFAREIAEEMSSARASGFSASASVFRFFYYGVGPGVALAALGGLGLAFLRKRQADWFVFWGFAPAFAFLALSSPFMNRYWMPVLLFPLLLAGQFAAEGSLPGRLGRWKWPRWLFPAVGVVALGASLFISAAYSRIYKHPDPRLRSARWIAKNTEPGERIGILIESVDEASGLGDEPDPWQFEIPPINPWRTPMVGLRMSPESLDKVDPDLVVLSEFQFPPLANRPPLTSTEQAFLRKLDDTERYELISFRNEPVLGGVSVALRSLPPPHDFRYADPGVRVYRKTGSD